MLMKLKNKIFLYSTFVFIIIIMVFSATIYWTFSHITYEREIERVVSEADNVLEGVQSADGNFPINDLLGVYVPSNGMIRILDSDGNQMTEVVSGEQLKLRAVDTSFEAGERTERFEAEGSMIAFVQIPTIWVDGQVAYVQLYENIDSVEQNLRTLQIVLILVAFIAIIPIIFSGRVLSDLIVRPIKSLIETMRDIRESNTFKHIELEHQSNDELSTMSKTFNEMMDLLKDNYEKQEAFVSNASHELRTPITVIESYANLVKRRGMERPEVVGEAIEAIHSEALRMKDLTEQLLLLARREKDWKLDLVSFSINEVIEEVKSNIERSYNREIRLSEKTEATIFSDKQKIKQLLYIFFDNARKYSERPIYVNIENGLSGVKIVIRDEGIGIPDESLPKVFDRFYRVDEARNREEGGSGLGLALAKDLSEALHVDIELSSELGQGTTVILNVHSFNSH
ncbi:two-component sensor histidine kinase [Halalkalibacillus sediminis]|uniref:histidine kinase n=2 Tax=Halalkalibacillus sediminis TaxID=2018042 RepID=A0A2I0QVR4_9BACI|nr:two-component sensor histidine kinase [Halalkalibacillus sediminis]